MKKMENILKNEGSLGKRTARKGILFLLFFLLTTLLACKHVEYVQKPVEETKVEETKVEETKVKETKVKETKAIPYFAPCADKDQDGVCDSYDRCPEKIGPVATFGCPIDPCGGEPLLLLVQFEYDSDKLPPSMYETKTKYPVLDEIAAVIAQDEECRVCIIGYASEEGEMEYNEELSKMRAASVKDYLVTKGVDADKLPSTGMGEKCQLIPASTHVLNRRVEFRRLEEGESCPYDCSPNR
jgi:outer membrane protein OmpA-like peptidoglycan-associated protein